MTLLYRVCILLILQVSALHAAQQRHTEADQYELLQVNMNYIYPIALPMDVLRVNGKHHYPSSPQVLACVEKLSMAALRSCEDYQNAVMKDSGSSVSPSQDDQMVNRSYARPNNPVLKNVESSTPPSSSSTVPPNRHHSISVQQLVQRLLLWGFQLNHRLHSLLESKDLPEELEANERDDLDVELNGYTRSGSTTGSPAETPMQFQCPTDVSLLHDVLRLGGECLGKNSATRDKPPNSTTTGITGPTPIVEAPHLVGSILQPLDQQGLVISRPPISGVEQSVDNHARRVGVLEELTTIPPKSLGRPDLDSGSTLMDHEMSARESEGNDVQHQVWEGTTNLSSPSTTTIKGGETLSSSDCDLLAQFYTETNREAPWLNIRWNLSSNCCNGRWKGITCNADGRVKFIDLRGNGIRGTLCSTWGSMTSLVTLHLNSNALYGRVPPEWANMSSIESLHLNSNALSGTLPIDWGNMKYIQKLYLDFNSLSGTLPTGWVNLPFLHVVDLSSNELTAMPSYLSPTGPIKITLMLAYNNIRYVPEVYFTSPRLQFLDVSFNPVYQLLPSMISIEGILMFISTSVYGLVPIAARNSTLVLTNCGNITGFNTSMPSYLTALYISGTNITSLPTNLTTIFPVMQIFSARGLGMQQVIPSFASWSPQLSTLDVAGNNFSGSLDLRLSFSPKFESLDISGNDQLQPLTSTINCPTSPDVLTLCPRCMQCAFPTPFNVLSTKVSPGPDTSCPPFSCGHSLWLPASSRHIVDLSSSTQLVFYFVNTFPSCQPLEMFTTERYLSNWSVDVITFPEGRRLKFPWSSVVQPLRGLSDGTFSFDPSQYREDFQYGIWYKMLFTFSYTDTITCGPSYPLSFNQLTAMTLSFSDSCPPNVNLVAVNGTRICAKCPDLGTCYGNTTIHTTKAAWRLNNSVLPFYPCDPGSPGCRSDGIVNDGSEATLCLEGYDGPFCSLCAKTYGMSLAGTCTKCGNVAGSIAVVVCSSVVVIVIVTLLVQNLVQSNFYPDNSVLVSRSSQSNFEALKSLTISVFPIGVKMLGNHWSLFALLRRNPLSKQLHSSARVLLSLQDAASSIGHAIFTALNCIEPYSLKVELVASLLAVVGFTLLEQLIVLLRSKCFDKRIKGRVPFIIAWIAVFQLSFSSIVSSASALIPYGTLTFYDLNEFLLNSTGQFKGNLEGSNFTYLVADRNIQQYNAGYTIFAWCVLCIMGIGVPVCVYLVVVLGRKEVTEFKAAILFGQSSSDVLKLSEIPTAFKFLTGNFTIASWYWELVIMARKFVCAVILLVFADYPTVQLVVLLTFVAMYLWLCVDRRPYLTQALQRGEYITVVGMILSINLLLVGGYLGKESAWFIAVTVLFVMTQILAFVGLLYCFGRHVQEANNSELQRDNEHSELPLAFYRAQ